MISLEASWLMTYLQAAWTAGWEAHKRNPEMSNEPMLNETRKIALMAAGFNPEEGSK